MKRVKPPKKRGVKCKKVEGLYKNYKKRKVYYNGGIEIKRETITEVQDNCGLINLQPFVRPDQTTST